MRTKAISLLSGGLDSTLATKLIADQDIDVTALHFTSPFASRKERERGLQAVRTADELKVRLIFREKGADYLSIIENPRHGYGKNMNPCIDCRIYMLKKTRIIMEEIGAGFVVTGEVLGQRPMSQQRPTLRLIEKESGLEGFIVRPLSAQHFDPTVPEREGVVDRERLLNVAGRGRSVQYALAAKYGLKEFSSPGGGCLLTDPIFSVKLRELFSKDKDFSARDIDLLSVGRHFRLRDDTKLIVGRNEEENEKLQSLWSAPYVLFTPVDFTGPQAVLKGAMDEEIIEVVANIMGQYGKNRAPTISVLSDDGRTTKHTVKRTDGVYEHLRIREAEGS
jgi:tRNA-specific 2-thiouridylase